MCGLSSWLWGDRHGAAGAPQRTQDKGEEPHPEDVKSPGGRGARAGGQVEASLEQKGGQLGAQRVWGPGVGEGLNLEGREGDGQGRWSWVGED